MDGSVNSATKFAYMVDEGRYIDLCGLARRAGREDIVIELREAHQVWLAELGLWERFDQVTREPY